MDDVSWLFHLLSLGTIYTFITVCYLISKCCMRCEDTCPKKKISNHTCRCFPKKYEAQFTASNQILVNDGEKFVPLYQLLYIEENEKNEFEENGIPYRNEACRDCCAEDNESFESDDSDEEVIEIHASRLNDSRSLA